MARNRPTASPVRQPALVCLDGITSTERAGDVLVTEEVVSIVIRASELGFSPWRVGNALRIAPMELAWICAHLDEHKGRRQILDHNLSRREVAVPGERVDQEVVEHDRRL